MLLELLKNVLVSLIINNMQLNILNNKKVILILMNYKLDNKLNKWKMNKSNMQLIIMIFIIELNIIILIKILL